MAKPTICINDSYIKDSGKAALYLRVFLQCRYCKIALDMDIEPNYFDKKTGIVTGGKDRKQLNLLLKNAVGTASNIILRYQFSKQLLTVERFEKEFSNPQAAEDVIVFMQTQLDQRHDISPNTRKVHITTINKLSLFRKVIMFADVDLKFIREFEFFMIKKFENKQNTVAKMLITLKSYLNIAITEGLLTENPFDAYKIRREQTMPEFLTQDERDLFKALYDAGNLSNKLQNVLRRFLFSCYSGLRVSDIKRITFDQIKGKLLIFKPYKTRDTSAKTLSLPLTKQALQFIKDENKVGLKGLIFKGYSEQKLNKYLKDISKIVSIEKNVTMHTGRHTFATIFLRNCSAANGVLMLQKLLGHSNISSTMVYAHILNADIQEQIDNFL